MFQKKRWLLLLLTLFLAFALTLAACQQDEEPETVEVTRIVEVESTPVQEVIEVTPTSWTGNTRRARRTSEIAGPCCRGRPWR